MRAKLIRVGLLIGSLLAVTGVAECASRVAFPTKRGVVSFRYDPRFRIRHRERVDGTSYAWGDGGPWRYRVNARGFRGGDWDDRPPAGKHRVVVTGDSFTFSNAVEEDEAFPAVGEKLAGDASLEVLNLGTSGWGPQNALAYLDTEGSALEGSCLVYTLFEGNDALDGIAVGLYSLHDGKLAKDAPPPMPRALAAEEKIRKLPGHDFLVRHSQLFNVLRSALLYRVTAGDPIERRATRIYEAPTADEVRTALDTLAATLTRLAELGRARFGAFGVILVPMRGQLSDPPDPKGGPFPMDSAAATHARVVAWAAEHGVPVLDLQREFPRGEELKRLYFRKDFHLSAAGNRRLGELFARDLGRLCGHRD